MRFLIENSAILFFFAVLIVGYFTLRFLQKRKLNVDDLLVLVWQSVALALTFTYVLGTLDFVLFESAYFGFSKNDIVIMVVPGIICLAVLAASVYYRYISKPNRRGKNQ